MIRRGLRSLKDLEAETKDRELAEQSAQQVPELPPGGPSSGGQ